MSDTQHGAIIGTVRFVGAVRERSRTDRGSSGQYRGKSNSGGNLHSTDSTEPEQQTAAPAVMILEPQLQEVREGETLIFSYESQNISLHMPDAAQTASTIMDWVRYQTGKADDRAKAVQAWAQERVPQKPDGSRITVRSHLPRREWMQMQSVFC